MITLEELHAAGQWRGKIYLYWNLEYGFLQVVEHGDWADETRMLLGESELITVPIIGGGEITRRQIETLRAKKQRVLAESQRRADELEHQIQNLLAIEYKPGATEQQED